MAAVAFLICTHKYGMETLRTFKMRTNVRKTKNRMSRFFLLENVTLFFIFISS